MASVCLGSRRMLIYGQRPQAEALPRCPLSEPLLGDPKYKWGRPLSSLVPPQRSGRWVLALFPSHCSQTWHFLWL